MAYEVIARKWRPQTFDDVVGQGHVTQTLKNAIKTSRIAHAFLLVGPRGIGKTSIARIFAKALNCTQRKAEEPCGKCDSCVEIARGASLDVVEIDGASNNSVDQIRDLRETVKYAPANAYKIYIIDEVHMLSTAAFNALLKTLEEPPSFVKFIFATTEPQKILPTIISRCQRFDLRRIPVQMIVERLKLIADTEKIKIDADALLAVARGAEGGLRDAESALDQLISFCGDKISEPDVLSVFGLVSRGMLEKMADDVLTGDVKALIQDVAELDEAGKDLQRVLLELMDHFRNLLVFLNVQGDIGGLDFTESQIDVLKRQAAATNTGRLLRVCTILSQADDKFKYALSRRTVLEMALIRSARAAVVVSLEEILSKLNELKNNVGAAGISEDDADNAGHVRQSELDIVAPPVQSVYIEQDEVDDEPEDETAGEVASQILDGKGASGNGELEKLRAQWHDILSRAEKNAPMIRSVLADAAPVSVGESKVVLGFDPEFADDSIKSFNAGRNRKATEMVLKSVLGRKVVVETSVGLGADGVIPLKKKVVEENSPVYSVQDEPVAGSNDGNKSAHGVKPKNIHEWTREKSANKVLEMFNGTIIDVRE